MRYHKVIKSLAIFILLVSVITINSGQAVALERSVLKGRVLDVDGSPVKGAEIFIYSSANTRMPADFISSKTGIEGRFSITLVSGDYWAVARLRGSEKFGPLMPGDKHSGEPVELELSEDDELEMDFTVVDLIDAARQMKKTGEDHIVIHGKITDSSGMAVRDHYAFANKSSDLNDIPDYISEWTDESGRYKIYLPPGRYFVGSSADFPPIKDAGLYMEVKVDSDMTEVDMVLKASHEEGR